MYVQINVGSVYVVHGVSPPKWKNKSPLEIYMSAEKSEEKEGVKLYRQLFIERECPLVTVWKLVGINSDTVLLIL